MVRVYVCYIIDAVHFSWKSLIKYCSDSKEEKSNGFENMLTNKDNLQLMCFHGDVRPLFIKGISKMTAIRRPENRVHCSRNNEIRQEVAEIGPTPPSWTLKKA